MPNYRFIAAILITFLTTAFAGVGTVIVLKMDDSSFQSNWVGLLLFTWIVLVAVAVLKTCTRFLYPRESAALSILGGIRFGSRFDAIMSGRSSTWPFAKLLADTNSLWIHTPWGTLHWPRTNDLVLRSRRYVITSVLTLPPTENRPGLPISFLYFGNALEDKLRGLGFKFQE